MYPSLLYTDGKDHHYRPKQGVDLELGLTLRTDTELACDSLCSHSVGVCSLASEGIT